ncbi:hypothetical protein CPLU01_02071 [Colletotrichum plurivorum]|uniref:Uncharacterized protein n=1 Tax=Colletotrichum plurivorum TaxID=2175906 RepID=A0A8H6NMG6_9PEZI|nr:hypothetical protein CPLU01_02071 [Colletotrichum plurivorum]
MHLQRRTTYSSHSPHTDFPICLPCIRLCPIRTTEQGRAAVPYAHRREQGPARLPGCSLRRSAFLESRREARRRPPISHLPPSPRIRTCFQAFDQESWSISIRPNASEGRETRLVPSEPHLTSRTGCHAATRVRPTASILALAGLVIKHPPSLPGLPARLPDVP